MGLFRSTVIYKVQFNIPLAGADFVGGGLFVVVWGGGAGTNVPPANKPRSAPAEDVVCWSYALIQRLRPSVMQQRRQRRIKANGAFTLANPHPNSPVFSQ